MQEAMFDADSFMSASTEGELSTEYTPVPEGEFNAVIDGVKARETSSSKGDFVILDITWKIDDAKVAEETGIENPQVRQSIFLDITASGGIDMGKGKNVNLGRLREAVNQNSPGPWSPSMLEGNVAKIRVAHRLWEGRTFADVKGVAAV